MDRVRVAGLHVGFYTVYDLFVLSDPARTQFKSSPLSAQRTDPNRLPVSTD
jgi:hypothetical protein